MADRVVCTIADGVADVRLNRPEKLNALDMALFTALAETAATLADTPAVRAVVLSGAGRSFCAGLDLTAFSAMAAGERWRPADDPTTTGADGRSRGQRAVLAWYDLPVPVIAAVRGHALGGGLQLALGADIRLAAPDATFSVYEINWGLPPDMAGTQLLPRLVGPDVAAELTTPGARSRRRRRTASAWSPGSSTTRSPPRGRSPRGSPRSTRTPSARRRGSCGRRTAPSRTA